MRRIAIVALRGDANKIYEYVLYLLKEIKDNVQALHIVYCGNLKEENDTCLRKVSPYIQSYSGNTSIEGFNIIVQQLGTSRLKVFDELLLVDDSLFGPLYSMQDVLRKMEGEKADFWGIVERNDSFSKSVQGGVLTRHFSPGFLVLRSPLLKDKRMIALFRELSSKECSEEERLAELHRVFQGWGYQGVPFCKTVDLDSSKIKKNIAQDLWNVYELVGRRKMPFLSKTAFLLDTGERLSRGLLDALPRTMDYLRNQGEYDEKHIWQWLLDHCNLADLRDRLNLYKIIPENIVSIKAWKKKRIAIISFCFYEEMFSDYVIFLEKTPKEIDLIIVTVSEVRRKKLEKLLARSKHHVQLLIMENRGRDWAALLVTCKGITSQYEYFCFLHDKKDSHFDYLTIGPNWARSFLENLVASSAYVECILDEFEENPRLGVMVPPNYCLNSNSMFRTSYWGCQGNLDSAASLLKKLGLRVPLDFTKPAVAVGSAFWCRRAALVPLLEVDWNYDDFPKEPYPPEGALGHVLERIFPYVAQGRGYYTVTVMAMDNARQQVTDWRYIAQNALQPIAKSKEVMNGRIHEFIHEIEDMFTKAASKKKVDDKKTLNPDFSCISMNRPKACWLVNPEKINDSFMEKFDGIISPNPSLQGRVLAGKPVAGAESLSCCSVRPYIIVIEDFSVARNVLTTYGYYERIDFICREGT